MMEWVEFFLWPIIGCLILTGIHTYLGLHVIEREVIFVDLALAQVVACGTAVALLWGFSADSLESYGVSLFVGLCVALAFALYRTLETKISQEVMIGITYAVAAAFSLILMDQLPNGVEELRHSLNGHLLALDRSGVVKLLILYLPVALIHWFFRKKFFELTISKRVLKNKEELFWDFLFYATFAVVIASSVKIGGILLVFSYLIIPPATAALISDSVKSRILIGWAIGTLGSGGGLWLSFYKDIPISATIICVFGGIFISVLLLSLGGRKIRKA